VRSSVSKSVRAAGTRYLVDTADDHGPAWRAVRFEQAFVCACENFSDHDIMFMLRGCMYELRDSMRWGFLLLQTILANRRHAALAIAICITQRGHELIPDRIQANERRAAAIGKGLEKAETDDLKIKLIKLLDETKRESERLEQSSTKRKVIARETSTELVAAMKMGTTDGICDALLQTIYDNRWTISRIKQSAVSRSELLLAAEEAGRRNMVFVVAAIGTQVWLTKSRVLRFAVVAGANDVVQILLAPAMPMRANYAMVTDDGEPTRRSMKILKDLGGGMTDRSKQTARSFLTLMAQQAGIEAGADALAERFRLRIGASVGVMPAALPASGAGEDSSPKAMLEEPLKDVARLKAELRCASAGMAEDDESAPAWTVDTNMIKSALRAAMGVTD